jgi:D-arginine dehydrogenase
MCRKNGRTASRLAGFDFPTRRDQMAVMRKVDTIVIGGGIAGLSAAARIARHGETLVLERESAPGYHSSGRSATFCHFGIGGGLVHKLTSIGKTAFAVAPEGDHPPLARRMAALFIGRANEIDKLGALEKTTRAHSPDTRRIEGEALRDIVPVLKTGSEGFAAGLLDPDAYKLDSDVMLQTNIRALREAGGNLVTDAPVNAIRRGGEDWIVELYCETHRQRRRIMGGRDREDGRHHAARPPAAPPHDYRHQATRRYRRFRLAVHQNGQRRGLLHVA